MATRVLLEVKFRVTLVKYLALCEADKCRHADDKVVMERKCRPPGID